MLVKALKSFAGAVSMGAGETRDIDDKAILSDLIAAGYVEAEKVANAKEAEIVEKPKSKKRAHGGRYCRVFTVKRGVRGRHELTKHLPYNS